MAIDFGALCAAVSNKEMDAQAIPALIVHFS
jgi:hypothetical protein